MQRNNPSSSRTALAGREIFFLAALAACIAVVVVPWVLSKVNKRDRLASFQNLQQWGIALNLYLIDNNNQLPEVGGVPIDAEPVAAWYNALPTYLARDPLGAQAPEARPQLGDGSIWFDPSAEPPRHATEGEFFFTYGMNRFLQPNPKEPTYSIYDLDTPGAIIFLTEKAGFTPGIVPSEVEFRHRKTEGGNVKLAFVLFCDGHVSFGSPWELLENSEALAPKAGMAPVSWVPYVGAPTPTEP